MDSEPGRPEGHVSPDVLLRSVARLHIADYRRDASDVGVLRFSMHWELWDTETGNLVGDYDSEDGAPAVVRDALLRLGPAAIAPLAPGAEHDVLSPILQGQDLVARLQRGPDGQAAGDA